MDLEKLEQREQKLLDELGKAAGNRQKELDLTAQLEVIDSLIRNKKKNRGSVIVSGADADEYFKKGMRFYNEGDYHSAFEYIYKAAGLDHAEAQCQLGYMYDEGIGVSQNYAEAVKWYQKAADQGYVKAIGNLGYLYENGLGVPKSILKALKLYREASDKGYKFASEQLARLKG